jgi:non-haem dioxygenase in morphine synthesis N-terminal
MATTTITEKLATTTLAEVSAPDFSKYDYKNLEPYVHPPETKEKLNWAELVTLDLEDFSREGGQERLAKQLEHAVHHVGFFYVKNYGLTQEEVDNQFTLAKHFFALPVDEKAKYECNYAAADYNGWRRSGRRLENKGFDNVEIFK